MRVGILLGRTPRATPIVGAILDGLREHGYVDGWNLIIEVREARGQPDQLPGLAAELVRVPVDVIVAGGEPSVRAALDTTRTIPIVMQFADDPVAASVVESLARPGGNATGVTGMATTLDTKRLELLKETMPSLARVTDLRFRTLTTAQDRDELTRAATSLGVQLQLVTVDEADLDTAVGAALGDQADALLVTTGSATRGPAMGRIVDLAAQRRMPAMYADRRPVAMGGLMSYGPNLVALYRQAGVYAARILEGTGPAELPVEEPREFDFVINQTSAQALGLTIPPAVLLQATEVIQ